MSLTRLIAAASIGLAVVLPAAAQFIPGSAPPPADSAPAPMKIEFQGNPKYLKVANLMDKQRNGLIMIQLELANVDNDEHKGYWRVKWLDESGFQVWDDEPWKPVTLHGSARQNLQAVAPTTKARDYRIQYNAEENRWTKPDVGSN
jgi:hypothetical protein